MLDPEFKVKWVAALESGEYQQGRGVLFTSAGYCYCCLGVACVVAGAEFKRHSVDGNAEAWLNGEKISDDGIMLAANFAERIGLSDEDQKALFHRNDGHLEEGHEGHLPKHSFKEIAAYIKENL